MIKKETQLRKILFLFIAVFVAGIANAKRIPGQIVDKKGDAIDAVFNIPFKFLSLEPNYEKIQYRIVYYDASNSKHVLRPDDAEEIKFIYNNQEIRMLSRPNTIGGGSIFLSNTHIFLKLVIDGRLKLFNYFYTQSSPGMYNGSTGGWTGSTSYSVENYILQKDNSELVQPRGISFKKDMSAYLSDCPVVAKRILEKELRRGDLEIIVEMYNEKCSR